MTPEEEAAFVQGEHAAFRQVLGVALRGIGRDAPGDAGLVARLAALEKERSEAIGVLRRLCKEHGSTDWNDNLHLADIIDKHLGRHL